MLVLDEQLLGRNLEAALGRWYRGPVLFITDLRPGTVIKDDAIPVLLRQQQQATFLTINEADFWRKVAIGAHVCVVCFALPDSRARENPELLRAAFRLPAFRTKARRMGKVLRVAQRTVSYYTYRERQIRVVPLCGRSQPKPCSPTTRCSGRGNPRR
jgi:hypothetical protein